MLDPENFRDLLRWVRENTPATEAESRAIAVQIGDTPESDADGNWTATVDGKTWTIPPMP